MHIPTKARRAPFVDGWRRAVRASRARLAPSAPEYSEAELGSLSPGKVADLVAVAGNPLADIAQLGKVQAIIHAGALVCAPGGPACRTVSP